MAARARRSISAGKGISRSYDDIEHREVYDGEQPKPGLYPGKLVAVEQHTLGEDSAHWTYEITSGLYKGWKGHVYTNGTSMKWKEEQQLVACGIIERGGKANVTWEEILKKAKPVRLRVINEEYQDEMRGKVKTVLPASEDAVDAPDEDEEDEDFAEGPKPSRARSRKKPEPKPETAEPEPDDEEDDESAERLAELESLSPLELKKEAKASGLKLADYRGKSSEEIIELIMESEFPEDEEDQEGDEDGEEGVDLDELEELLTELDSAALKAKGKEFGLTLKDMRGKDDEALIELIMEKAEEMGDKLPF